MQCFKENNPNWSLLRVIVIDKDFTEWKILKEEFPNSQVLFCQWHVMKAMFKKVVDCEIEKTAREAAKQLLRSLVYSKNEDEYQRLKQQVFTETNKDFKEYFIKSWDDCQEMWVTYKRDSYSHLGSTTNNRLESHNQKLKDLTS